MGLMTYQGRQGAACSSFSKGLQMMSTHAPLSILPGLHQTGLSACMRPVWH